MKYNILNLSKQYNIVFNITIDSSKSVLNGKDNIVFTMDAISKLT